MYFSHQAPQTAPNADSVTGGGLAFRYLSAAQRQRGEHDAGLHANCTQHHIVTQENMAINATCADKRRALSARCCAISNKEVPACRLSQVPSAVCPWLEGREGSWGVSLSSEELAATAVYALFS